MTAKLCGGAFYKDYPQTCDPNDCWSQSGAHGEWQARRTRRRLT